MRWSPAGGGASRYTGLEPPFEGRDEDLRLVKELFNATVREKRARLVSVIGQAGTGKSRLIREFEKYIDGLADLVYWHDGRSPAYGEGISFWALGEMVRNRAGLAERDDDATTRQRIAACSPPASPTKPTGAGSSHGCTSCSASARHAPASARSCSGHGDCSSNASPNGARCVMAFEDLEFGRQRACSTSSTT